VNYFLERRNYDFEQSSSCITELLLLLLRQLLLRRVIYGLQILSMFSVAVELPLSSHAIILSLPRSSFELIPLIIAKTQEHWGSDQVIFKDNNPAWGRSSPSPVAVLSLGCPRSAGAEIQNSVSWKLCPRGGPIVYRCHVSPTSAQRSQSLVSPTSAQRSQSHVSPTSAQRSQSHVSPTSAQRSQSLRV